MVTRTWSERTWMGRYRDRQTTELWMLSFADALINLDPFLDYRP